MFEQRWLMNEIAQEHILQPYSSERCQMRIRGLDLFGTVTGVLGCCSAKKKEAITVTACVVLELLGSSLFMATSTEVRVIPSPYVHARFRPCHGKIFGFVSQQNFVVSSRVRGLEEMDLFIQQSAKPSLQQPSFSLLCELLQQLGCGSALQLLFLSPVHRHESERLNLQKAVQKKHSRACVRLIVNKLGQFI